MSRWIKERRKERYYRKSKKSGYRSRASYKLLQLDRKHRLIRRGDRVLDIGCAPGGWSQAASELVGPGGIVVGVDLDDTAGLDGGNAAFLVGDIFEEDTIEAIRRLSPEFDVVISDASPKISGVWSRDHLLSVDLADRALEVSRDLLVEGGNMVVKVFQGPELRGFFRKVQDAFEYAKRSKPDASRGKSSEIYVVGKGFRRP